MGKAPAFQFYVKDWLSDPELQCVSTSSRGMWIDALCYMWEAPERGKLIGTPEELSKLLRATNGNFTQFMDDLKRHKFADVTMCNNEITLVNRRMQREEKERNNTRLRVSRYRSNAKCNVNVTPPSSSSSPSAIQKKYIKKRNILSDDEFLTSLKEKFTWVDFEREMAKIDAWFLANPGRQKTRRFIVKWISKVEKPMGIISKPIPHKESDGKPSWIGDAMKEGWKI